LRRHPVMIEEIEDNDARRMNTKPKLSNDSTYIPEDNSDDKQILFDHMEIKTNCKHKKSKVNKNTPEEISVSTGMRYERPRTPEIKEYSVPTLHSDLFKYRGPPRRKRSY